VADAVVTVRHQGTAALRQAVAGDDGRYAFNLLRPGLYTVQVQAPGYLSVVRESVTLPLQGTVILDFPLAPTFVEEVTVTGAARLLDPTNTTGGFLVGAEELSELPLPGRQFTDLAMLDAAVLPVAPGTFVGEKAAVFSANGQGGRANTFLVDGLDNNDATIGSRSNALFSQEVIQEFHLMTDGYQAEFGRATGGVLNIITRSGGNRLAGKAFLQSSGERWNETGEFAESLPPAPDDVESVERLQFGAHLSGPIRRDRAFYFLAYEQDAIDEVLPYVGVTRNGAPGGRLLARNRGRNAFARFDVVLGANHQLQTRLSWDRSYAFGVNVGGVITPEAGSRFAETTGQFAASLTSAFGQRWYNELRLLASHSDVEQLANSDRVGVDRPSGIFGGTHVQEQDRGETRFQLVDNVSYFRGNHALKFGIDVARVSVDIGVAFNDNGLFLYTNDRPYEPGDNGLGGIGARGVDDDGDGVVDELPDFETYALAYQLIQGSPRATFDTTIFAAFVQDEVRVTPHLRVNFGLRYDLDTLRLDDRFAIRGAPPNRRIFSSAAAPACSTTRSCSDSPLWRRSPDSRCWASRR
jgi:hypothetical protein